MQIDAVAARDALGRACDALAASISNQSPLFPRVVQLGMEVRATIDALTSPGAADASAELAALRDKLATTEGLVGTLRDALAAGQLAEAQLRADRDALASQVVAAEEAQRVAAERMAEALAAVDVAQQGAPAPAPAL